MIKSFLIVCGMCFVYLILARNMPEWSAKSLYNFESGLVVTYGIVITLVSGIFFWRSLGHKGK